MDSKKEHEQFTISQCAILIRNDKCLIGQFSFNAGYWGLPRGRIDKGEDPIAAFKRELKEEIGLLDFEIVERYYFDIWYNPQNIPRCAVFYLIKSNNTEIKNGQEFLKTEWVAEDDLDKYNFVWPNAIVCIKKGFARNNDLKKLS